MILTGPRIIDCVNLGHIEIDPFNEGNVNPNSVDLTLGPELRELTGDVINPFAGAMYLSHVIPNGFGFTIQPGKLYLASTVERVFCMDFRPGIEGKSSLARAGLSVHLTAGFGEHGFNGQWTLELTTVKPFILRPGMRICQVYFEMMMGQLSPYKGRYQHQQGPTESRYHQG